MSITIEIDIETDSRIPQGWAPWVGSSGLDPQALHTYSGSLLVVGALAGQLKLHPRITNSCQKLLLPPFPLLLKTWRATIKLARAQKLTLILLIIRFLVSGRQR